MMHNGWGIMITESIIWLIGVMDDPNKEKQQYLYQEIIEKKYDAEQFQEYLSGYKPFGDDLENWSMSQLRESVSEFQKQQDNEESSANPP